MTWQRSGKVATECRRRAISAAGSGWRKTGRPKVASVMNRSQATGVKAAQVGSGWRL